MLKTIFKQTIGIIMRMAIIILIFSLSLQNVSAQQRRYAIITMVKGNVEVRLAENEWQKAEKGMILYPNDEIRTGKKDYAQLWLDKNASTGRLEVKGGTRMRLNILDFNAKTNDKTTLLGVAIGRVMIHAQKLHGNSRFEVQTPTSIMGVRGTSFEVIVEEKEKKK